MALSTKAPGGTVHAAPDGVVDELLRRFGADARATTVFGEPVDHEGMQVIPVARVGWGFGTGRRGNRRSSSNGLGAGMGVSPAGFIEITDGGAHFRPIRPWWAAFTYVLGGGLLAVLLFRRRAKP